MLSNYNLMSNARITCNFIINNNVQSLQPLAFDALNK